MSFECMYACLCVEKGRGGGRWSDVSICVFMCLHEVGALWACLPFRVLGICGCVHVCIPWEIELHV